MHIKHLHKANLPTATCDQIVGTGTHTYNEYLLTHPHSLSPSLISIQMRPAPTARLGRSATPRAAAVCVRPSAWSLASPCAAATAPPTPASASSTCAPARSRWSCGWSARASAVSGAWHVLAPHVSGRGSGDRTRRVD